MEHERTRFDGLAALVGDKFANDLIDQVGGADMKIPHAACRWSPFEMLFGKDLAQKVKHEFGGLVVYIPKSYGQSRATRNAKILERFGKGDSIERLARNFRLTERRISQILQEQKENRLEPSA